MNNSQCVTDYTIIPAGDGVVREDIPVAIEDLGVAIRVDGYDVCLYTYNFTIVATTPAGELRRTVPQDDPIDLSGNFIPGQYYNSGNNKIMLFENKKRPCYLTRSVCMALCLKYFPNFDVFMLFSTYEYSYVAVDLDLTTCSKQVVTLILGLISG